MTITIKHMSDTWEIIGEGTVRDGMVFCHLASTTKGRQQRNGWYPTQICDWIDQNVILSAAIEQEEAKRRAINDYYTDRASGVHSALAK